MVTANFVESNSVVRQPSEIIGLRAVCVHQNECIDRFFFGATKWEFLNMVNGKTWAS